MRVLGLNVSILQGNLDSWRELRTAQDREYEESLQQDIAKVQLQIALHLSLGACYNRRMTRN